MSVQKTRLFASYYLEQASLGQGTRFEVEEVRGDTQSDIAPLHQSVAEALRGPTTATRTASALQLLQAVMSVDDLMGGVPQVL